ncbi:vWA domain-containing protein [Nonomuraea sp. NPDC050404]|uniref:vWA domain-containing protein n=1 Tax=Nonomuraea sp. NPDC050404 TaxID=3155783 RepID=UPI0033D854A6
MGFPLLALLILLVLRALSKVSPEKVRRRVTDLGARWWHRFGERTPDRLGRWAARLRLGRLGRLSLAVYLAALAGACAVAVPWLLVRGGAWLHRQVVPGPCATPLELSVMTAPENVHALRAEARSYMKDRSADGCARHRVSVYASPAPADMHHGFRHAWTRGQHNQSAVPFVRLLSPRPDLWVATTTQERDLVLGRGRDTVESEDGGTITVTPAGDAGTDRLTLAVPGVRRDALPQGMDAAGLATAVSDARGKLKMRLVYPQPSLSVAGLLAASRVVATDDGEQLARSTAFGGTVMELLCRFRAAPPDERRDLALLVPARVVREGTEDVLTRFDCPGESLYGHQGLHDVESEDGPLIKHPIYHVLWPGPRERTRYEAARDLAGWLDRTSPLGRPAHSDDKPLETSLDSVRAAVDAKLPPIRVQVALDGSGSMVRSPAAPLPGIQDAFTAVRPALGSRDALYLSSFFRAGGATTVTASPAAYHLQDWDRLLQRLVPGPAGAADAPVSQALKKLADKIDAPGMPVIVITDGGPFDDERDAFTAVRRAERASDTVGSVHILVVGDRPCPPGGTGAADTHRVTCVAVAADELEKALRTTISAIRDRSQ